MARHDSDLRDEVAELQNLLARAKAPGNVRDLSQLLADKQQALAATEQPAGDIAAKVEDVPMEDASPATATLTPAAAPAAPSAHAAKSVEADDLNVYTEISRFGWEDEGASA